MENKNNQDDTSYESMFGPKQVYVKTEKTEYRCHTIYLDGPIEDVQFYRPAFEILENVGEGDLVRLIIDSPGGYLASAIRFVNMIRNCQADVIGVLSGVAQSAASLILLACPSVQIMPYSSMMAHSASWGAIGSTGNVYDNVAFTTVEINRFMNDVYKGFLTDDEIEDVKKGRREIWLNEAEIGRRLEAMYTYQANAVKEEIDKMQEMQDNTPPAAKKPRKQRQQKSNE